MAAVRIASTLAGPGFALDLLDDGTFGLRRPWEIPVAGRLETFSTIQFCRPRKDGRADHLRST